MSHDEKDLRSLSYGAHDNADVFDTDRPYADDEPRWAAKANWFIRFYGYVFSKLEAAGIPDPLDNRVILYLDELDNRLSLRDGVDHKKLMFKAEIEAADQVLQDAIDALALRVTDNETTIDDILDDLVIIEEYITDVKTWTDYDRVDYSNNILTSWVDRDVGDFLYRLRSTATGLEPRNEHIVTKESNHLFNGNIRSMEESTTDLTEILDDDFTRIGSLINEFGVLLITARNPTTNFVETAIFNATAEPSTLIILEPSLDIWEASTGVPTGTTGLDGRITFFADLNGDMYIENRYGTTMKFTFLFIG